MTLLSDVIGESPGITAIRDTIGRLLRRHSGTRRLPPVLIQAETGTGEWLVARGLQAKAELGRFVTLPHGGPTGKVFRDGGAIPP